MPTGTKGDRGPGRGGCGCADRERASSWNPLEAGAGGDQIDGLVAAMQADCARLGQRGMVESTARLALATSWACEREARLTLEHVVRERGETRRVVDGLPRFDESLVRPVPSWRNKETGPPSERTGAPDDVERIVARSVLDEARIPPVPAGHWIRRGGNRARGRLAARGESRSLDRRAARRPPPRADASVAVG